MHDTAASPPSVRVPVEPAPVRDRFIDAVRAGSLLIVVVGHWLLIVPSIRGGVARGVMLYDAAPAFWPVTWLFQVIPLFFFVGGFANLVSWRSRPGPGRARGFLARRLRRLLVPTGLFLVVWVGIEVVMAAFGWGGGAVLRGMELGQMTPFAPLWFLGVYLALVLLAPVSIRLHERFGWRVPAAMVVAVGATDAITLGVPAPAFGLVNLVLVYGLAFQLGYFYADGRLQRLSPASWAAVAALALAVLAVLTTARGYGRNLFDNGNLILGTAAPTLPFAVVGVMLIAALLAVRGPLSSWLARPRAWSAVSASNSVLMTVFLWHMTAYFGALAVLAALGLPLPAGPDATWWLERPLFVVAPALLLVPLVRIFAGVEHASARRHGTGSRAERPSPNGRPGSMLRT